MELRRVSNQGRIRKKRKKWGGEVRLAFSKLEIAEKGGSCGAGVANEERSTGDPEILTGGLSSKVLGEEATDLGSKGGEGDGM